jgi:Uma2 family endonuclease
MSEAAQRRATYEDVLNAPPHLVAELIHGTLVTSPRPAAVHALTASTLGMDLGNPFQRGRGGPGGWWILDEPELHLGADVLVPDLAGWRRERMPEVPDTPYFELAPDWLCEVLSPSTEAHDRTDKLSLYGAAGVAWVWLANPRLRTLEVLQNHEGNWVLRSNFRGDAAVRAQPFEAVELTLGDLWPARAPTAC